MPASAFTATSAQSAPTQSAGQQMMTTRATKMHEKAKARSKSVGVKAETMVSVLSTSGKWSQVNLSGKRGYIPSDAFTATISTKARLHKKQSAKSKSTSLKSGAKVSVFCRDGDWYKVKSGKRVGYVKASAVTLPGAAPTPAPTSAPGSPAQTGSYKRLKPGSKGESVLKLQRRLEALGYLNAVPDSKYRAATTSAVKLFQKDIKHKSTGVADSQTQQALYEAGAPNSSIRSTSLRKGNKGAQVKRLQLRLKAKGYYKGKKANGKFKDATESAVKGYQSRAGLTADGIAGKATLQSLFSSSAPANSGKPVPTPTPTPAPTQAAGPARTPSPTAPPASASKKKRADQVISVAMRNLGKPYVFGSSGPNSFDCSGFTKYAYATVGIVLPHSAYQQGYNSGRKVTMSQLQRGDLVCWNTGSSLSSHVGIYLGNGQAIHASSGSRKVVISSILTGYYLRTFSWGRALL